MTGSFMHPRPSVFAIACYDGPLRPWQERCVSSLIEAAQSKPAARIIVPRPANVAAGDVIEPSRDVGSSALGPIPTLSSDDVRVPSLSLEFIVWLEFTDPPPGLLHRAALGVWSFRFGDADTPGTPPCFWECFDGKTIAGAALMRTTALGATAVVRRGCVAIEPRSLEISVERLLLEIARWPADAVHNIAAGAPLMAPRQKPRGDRAGPPSKAARLELRLRCALRAVARAGDILFADTWNVGIARAEIAEFAGDTKWPAVEWLTEAPSPDYRADPFGMQAGERQWACVEYYDGAAARGRIEAIPIQDGSWGAARIAMLADPHHRSYPYLIEDRGMWYCMPETLGEDSLSMFRAIEPPADWIKVASLLSGVHAVDATLFRHGDRWWLFCSEDVEPRHHRLLAFYADALSGPYIAHACNPVKIDPRTAGCAGTPFAVDGALFRPSQDCSSRYGGAIAINRIVELTPTTFREELTRVVKPHPRYPDGVHTLSSLGAITLVDGKRKRFTLRRLAWRLRRMLRRNAAG